MAAGFFTKTLNTLLVTSARWVEFADGLTAPVHGAVQIDPSTGLPIDLLTAPASTRLMRNSAASTNSTTIKSTAGYVHRIDGYNAKATAVHLRLFNKDGADAAGDVPRKILYLPPIALFSFVWPSGLYFSTAIAFGFTTDNGATSSNAIAANDIVNFNVDYN